MLGCVIVTETEGDVRDGGGAGGVTVCRHCGAVIERGAGRGRPREYCPERDCQAAAKKGRELRRATPGLEGALARAEELYERMEKGLAAAVAPLAQVLADELSPAGVEARISAVQAEAHTRVAIARTEREQAFEQVRLAREAAEHARRERDQMRGRMDEAMAERDTALSDAETAREQALAALREASATERRSRQAAEEADRRAAAAETARDQAVRRMTERAEQTAAEIRDARAEAEDAGKRAERAAGERDAARIEAEMSGHRRAGGR
jgi:hypothetical protein